MHRIVDFTVVAIAITVPKIRRIRHIVRIEMSCESST